MLSYLIICIHESFGFVKTQSCQIQAFEKGAVFMRTKTQYKRSNKKSFFYDSDSQRSNLSLFLYFLDVASQRKKYFTKLRPFDALFDTDVVWNTAS